MKQKDREGMIKGIAKKHSTLLKRLSEEDNSKYVSFSEIASPKMLKSLQEMENLNISDEELFDSERDKKDT